MWGSIALGAGMLLGNVVSGIMQNDANQRMNAQNLKFAYLQRDDQLQQNAFDNRLAVQDRAYRDKMTAYQQLQDRRAEMRSAASRDSAFRQNAIATLGAGGTGGGR